MLSDPAGDVRAGSLAGLFHRDTRLISEFRLTIDGQRLRPISSGQTDFHAARFFLTNPPLDGIPAGSISVQRHRVVWEDVHEDVIVQSHLNAPVSLTLTLTVDADFADLFEVKEGEVLELGRTRRRADERTGEIRLDHRLDGFSANALVWCSRPALFAGSDVRFDLELDPRASWHTCVVIGWGDEVRSLVSDHEMTIGRRRGRSAEGEPLEDFRKWRRELPLLRSDSATLERVHERSVADLGALRLDVELGGISGELPAAGLPWFMTIFGRDTLITAYQTLLTAPRLAKGALRVLAALQGRTKDDFRDEEPGKMLHELRAGRLTVTGQRPHDPYYGSADATPLWLVVLAEYAKLTANERLVRELWPSAMRAMAWIDSTIEAGGGFVRYQTRSPKGLRNQGWRDSSEGVQFADGTLAEPPIALCEVQGYVYDAKVRTARLARDVMHDEESAARFLREAEELQVRFDQEFWIGRRGGYYALGLEGSGRKINALTSNIGHLLWSGIVPEDRSEAIVARLFAPGLWSGWGVRTASSRDLGYNPISYHNGTVWPHDNSLISAGLARYGHRDEANKIALAMFEAAALQGYRLPEVLAGYARRESRFPVRYPSSSVPQAWATGAPFLWLRILLGIDVADRELTCDPAVPEELGSIRIEGLHALGGRNDLEVRGSQGSIGPSSTPSH
jgi:glycogen debranching enzyme